MRIDALTFLIPVLIITAICLLCKLLKASIRIAATLICLYLIASIAFGNGRGYVVKISSFFEGGDKIVKYYDDYRDRTDKEGAVNRDFVDDFLERVKSIKLTEEK